MLVGSLHFVFHIVHFHFVFVPSELSLQTLQGKHLVANQVRLELTVLVLVGDVLFKRLHLHLRGLELDDLGGTQVNQLLVQGLGHHFHVTVLRALGETEE